MRTTDSAVDIAVGELRSRIAKGRLVCGQRLPEPDLSVELEISKPVLREAFARLQADGVLELQRFRGATVLRLSPNDVDRMLRICAAFEGLAAGEAARNVDQGDNLLMFETASKKFLAGTASSQSDLFDMTGDLLATIYRLADNPYLDRLTTRVHNPLLRQFMTQFVRYNAKDADRSKAFARSVIDAIRKGDEGRAEIEMRNWVHGERQRIHTSIPDREMKCP